MIIYNVTSKADIRIADQWLLWMKQEHIPEIMSFGHFIDFRISRLLDQDESEGITFAVQFVAPSLPAYEEYINVHAAEMRRKANIIWGNQVISFRTLMEVIN